MMNKRASFLSLFWRSLFLQALWNFEGLQNAGFLFILFPLIKRLYPSKDKRREILLRHIEFFNTQPYMASIDIGLIARMEVEDSINKTPREAEISNLKKSTAGPFAAMGDAFFWASFRPFVAILIIGLVFLTLKTMPLANLMILPVMFFFIYNSLHLTFRYWAVRLSYELGDKIIQNVISIDFQKIVNFLRVASGLLTVLILAYYFFSFAVNLKWVLSFAVVFVLSFAWFCKRLPVLLFFYLIIVFSGIISALFLKQF